MAKLGGADAECERAKPAELFAFLAVFTRLGAAFMVLPGFGEAVVPARIRLGMALAMYIDDYDETCFFFGHNSQLSRANPSVPLGASRENRWWNQIRP